MPKFWKYVDQIDDKGEVVRISDGSARQVRKDVEYPTNKFWITTPRYIGRGREAQFIDAAPDRPALITVPEGDKVDSGMRPYEEPPVTDLKPAHAGIKTQLPGTAEAEFSKPVEPKPAELPAEAAPAGKGKRASDRDVG